jgi:riboflavin kinase/FMN adenylyltransferase
MATECIFPALEVIDSRYKNFYPLKIIVGENFRFGKDRKGDIHLLSKYFNVEIVKPICCPSGIVISSSRIRELISRGETDYANLLIGWQ